MIAAELHEGENQADTAGHLEKCKFDLKKAESSLSQLKTFQIVSKFFFKTKKQAQNLCLIDYKYLL